MGYWNIILPEATTNLIPNPSFETGTTGWAAGATGSIAQSTDYSKFGAYSLKCTFGATPNVTLAAYTITLTASTFYYITAWVYVPTGYDGDNLSLFTANFLTSTSTNIKTWVAGTDANDTWIMLSSTVQLSADATGDLRLRSDVGSTGQFVYLDGYQIEQKTYSTTYCDGDQSGCIWNGTAHASTSTRNALEASGGVVTNFGTGLSLHIANEMGSGMPTLKTNAPARPLQPGALLQSQTINARQIVFNSTLNGTSVTTYHNLKRALLRALNAHVSTIGDILQPRLLRYTGATVHKEIMAIYDSGLEGGLPFGFTDYKFDLSLIAPDPMFYQIGESASALDPGDSATMSRVAARVSGTWSAMGNPSASAGAGGGTKIYCSARYEDTIYFGGDFINFNGNANADYIVAYSISAGTYSALSTGLSHRVWDMVVDGTGTLYIVGDFTNAGGDANADYIAKWNGSAFSAVGDPVTGATWTRGYKCCIDTNGNLWVGGGGTNIAGIANADYIAYWDGSSWNAAGTGMNGDVRGLRPDNRGGVYASGDFTTAGGTAAAGVAYWSGTAWSAMGNGMNPTAIKVSALAVDENNFVYVGETCTDVSGSPYISKWTGAGWEGLGTGLNGGCYDMKPAANGDLYLAGTFTTADGVTVNGAAIWNGTTFAPLDVNLPGSAVIEAFEFLPNEDIYFGYDTTGTATYAGSTSISYNGTAKAYPYIRIKRSGGTSANLIAITNWTTKSTLYFNSYAILDGEELIIDTRPGKQSVTSSFTGNRQDSLLRNSHLGNFFLVPSNADSAMTNQITMFIDQVGAPTMTVNMIWRDTYWSQD